MSRKVSVAILGSTGYVGLELVKILSNHPEIEIVFLGTENTPNISLLRQKIDKLNIGNSEIQEFGDPQIILFKLESNSQDGQENNSIIEQFNNNSIISARFNNRSNY